MVSTTDDKWRRLEDSAVSLFDLVRTMSTWKEREDGMVYSDEPLTAYLRDARALVAHILGESV